MADIEASLKFERVHHVAANMENREARRALFNQTGDGLVERAEKWTKQAKPFAPGDVPIEVQRDQEWNEEEDRRATERLKDSRVRTDEITDERRKYYDPSNTPEGASNDLHCVMKRTLLNRTPAAAALLAGAPQGPNQETNVNMKEALAAYRLSSTAPWVSIGSATSEAAVREVDERAKEYAQRRLNTIQTDPSLGRLFRFFVDFTCDLKEFEAAVKVSYAYNDSPVGLGKTASPTLARFMILSLDIPSGNPLFVMPLHTLAKLRTLCDDKMNETAEHFYPCTREEVDVFATPKDARRWAIVDQTDGIVNLGQSVYNETSSEPRWDIVNLDTVAATAAEYDRDLSIPQNKTTYESEGLLTPGADEFLRNSGDPRNRTLRGGGLVLTDRWRQWHATLRHVDSQQQIEDKANGKVLLDASDLTVGYKVDVGVRIRNDSVNRNRWHSLMHRFVSYTLKPSHLPTVKHFLGKDSLDDYIRRLYPDDAASREGEDAMLQAPIALRSYNQPKPMLMSSAFASPDHTQAFTEENLAAWRGGPLALATEKEKYRLTEWDLLIGKSYSLPTRSPGLGDDLVPPRLRFGWRYHFGLRAAFAGGVSVPLKYALTQYEFDHSGAFVKPPARADDGALHPGASYLRNERIDAPTILVPDSLFGALSPRETYTGVELKGRFPVPQAARMVVKTVKDSKNRSVLDAPKANDEKITAGFGFDRRVLLVPSVSLEFATLHGAFDSKNTKFETNVKMLEPRVRDDDEPQVSAEEYEGTEWVPVSAEIAVNKPPTATWKLLDTLWREFTIKSRPLGGLRGVDHRAAWGGFPIYRASLSDGVIAPVKDAVVVPPPQTISDNGEILHRTKGKGALVTKGAKQKRIFWAAQGILPSEAALERAGTAVFRRLPSDRDRDVERIPYYPDPAASTLVVRATIRNNKKGQANPLLARVDLYSEQPGKHPVAKDYPNARPVVLDVVRGATRGITIAQGKLYSSLPFAGPTPPDISVCHVTLSLAVGEETDIDCWCVPSELYLTHMSAIASDAQAVAIQRGLASDRDAPPRKGGSNGSISLAAAFEAGLQDLMPNTFKKMTLDKKIAFDEPDEKTLTADGEAKVFQGYGGLPILGPKASATIATCIREWMLSKPMPEIAAVTRIEAVHAIDLPQLPVIPPVTFVMLRTTTERIPTLLCKSINGHKCEDPLYDPVTWTLQNQMPQATHVLLDGTLKIDGPSTKGIEIVAEGTAAARGLFDDVTRGRSRDDRSRGLWPKPDGATFMKPKYLFGFDVNPDGTTRFTPERVTLLRLDGLPANTTDINLLAIQRDAEDLAIKDHAETPLEKGEVRPPLRAERPAAFPDARARYVSLFATYIARHTSALRTRYDELPPVSTASSSPPTPLGPPLWLAATLRPPRIAALSCIPSFAWNDSTPVASAAKLPSVNIRRSAMVRIRMKRPWFGSGEGERLGVVIWPPNLFELETASLRNDIVAPPPTNGRAIDLKQLPDDGSTIAHLVDADLGPGGSWVTRWGSDPIRSKGRVHGWLLSKANFPRVEILNEKQAAAEFGKSPDLHPAGALVVSNVLMPLPADPDAASTVDVQSASGFMSVSLITFAPRFDPEQENWYVDVEVDPCGASYPFLRFGLVRFQPNAPRQLQVSEPVVEWAQIMPERSVRATATKIEARQKVRIDATIEGLASSPEVAWPHRNPTERAPSMHVSLLRRWTPEDGQKLGPETVHERVQVIEPQCGADCTTWTTSFTVSAQDYEKSGDKWSIFVEEIERRRPARYLDEPRYKTTDDDYFADAGPRFAARLSLDSLHVGG